MSVLPDYRKGVYNVPHTVLRNFGIKTGRHLSGFADMGGDRLYLILVDALGLNLSEIFNFLFDNYEVITSVFPSTTSAAITTIFTGLSPREHGILEWYMYYEQAGEVIKTLPFSPMHSSKSDELLGRGVDPGPLFSLPTIFQRLKENGVSSTAFIPEEYVNSSYSSFMLRGSTPVGYGTIEDLPSLVHREGRDFIYIYTDVVDTAQHRYGPRGDPVVEEVKRVLKIIERIVESDRNASFIITADHGQTEIRRWRRVNVSEGCPFGGSPRDLFLYCDFDEGLNHDEFLFLLGPGVENPHLKERMPRRLILGGDNEAVWPMPHEVKGLHGGLSEDEMLVPFVVIERS